MPAASANDATKNEVVHFDNKAELLRYLYADLTRLNQVASPDIVLHCYDKATSLYGIAAAQAHEEALVAITGGTLQMDIKAVDVSEEHGVVHGFIRAHKPGQEDLNMQFRGVWHFKDGKIVEHFEEIIGDPMELDKWLGSAGV
ncbi:hypothetical protein GQX73_g4295 [Xylaria multiplex]|uniref:SnoaL-like domain-containing protein n=1 Tax=Xylaria multiplex TaxID=323545 RepID=A0A7C8MVT9_9PEZI|nr:hypothetical protein GQX73_g4295 [Xylaria multiplex]